MQHGVLALLSTQLQDVLERLWMDGYTRGLGQPASVYVKRVVATAVGQLSAAWLNQIARTTVSLIAKALIAGVALSKFLNDKSRARTIAITEFRRARTQAEMDAMNAAGVTRIRWRTTSSDPCQHCLDNQAASKDGWPLGVPFPSGAMCSPDHPNCECEIEAA